MLFLLLLITTITSNIADCTKIKFNGSVLYTFDPFSEHTILATLGLQLTLLVHYAFENNDLSGYIKICNRTISNARNLTLKNLKDFELNCLCAEKITSELFKANKNITVSEKDIDLEKNKITLLEETFNTDLMKNVSTLHQYIDQILYERSWLSKKIVQELAQEIQIAQKSLIEKIIQTIEQIMQQKVMKRKVMPITIPSSYTPDEGDSIYSFYHNNNAKGQKRSASPSDTYDSSPKRLRR